MNKKKLIYLVPLGIVGVAAFIALGGYIVQHLWNWLLPALFGFREVTFWQALGILVLSRILFGGFGMHGSDKSGPRRRKGMTPEERGRLCQTPPEPDQSGVAS